MAIDVTAMFKLSCGLYVVGVKDGDELGGCIVDAVIQTTAAPVTLALCSICKNRTNELIKKTGRFSISILCQNCDPAVIARFGFQSCRKAVKWQALPDRAEREGLPVLAKAAGWLVCEVRQSVELGTHTMFLCNVLFAEKGEGEPLTYNYYRDHMKDATVAAFKTLR
jgi:flavin reductase (DIM6/NTAB) family NADH-FMN oxidoreductase RutF